MRKKWKEKPAMIRDGQTYTIGTSVLLTLPRHPDYSVTDGLKKWDGCIFRIRSMKKVTQGGGKGVATTWVFELDGCKSRKGVHYGVVLDWIERTAIQGYGGGFKP